MTFAITTSPQQGFQTRGGGGRGSGQVITLSPAGLGQDMNPAEVLEENPCQIPNCSIPSLDRGNIFTPHHTSSNVDQTTNTNFQKSNEKTMSFSVVANLVRVFYLPLLWQSLCGGFEFIRYVLLGQSFVHCQDQAQPGLVAIQVSSYGSWNSTMESPATAASWLTCLVLLALVAMAVHPDGFTWMAVRKLRDLLMTILQSSSTCWAWLLNDETGVVSTVLALATFFSLFFFCYVLHRTLAPKPPPQRRVSVLKTPSSSVVSSSCMTSEKSISSTASTCSTSKKKKKKKHSSKKRNAIQATASSRSETLTSCIDQIPDSTQQLPISKENKQPVISSPTCNESILPGSLSSRASTDTTISQEDSNSSHFGSSLLITTSPAVSIPEKSVAPPLCQPKPQRARVSSSSTVETTASSFLEDDPSPTASVTSQYHSKPRMTHNSNNHHHHHHNRAKRNNNNANNRGGRFNNHHQNNNTSQSNTTTNNSKNNSAVSSRWDALKPISQTSNRTVRSAPSYNHNKRNGGNEDNTTSVTQQRKNNVHTSGVHNQLKPRKVHPSENFHHLNRITPQSPPKIDYSSRNSPNLQQVQSFGSQSMNVGYSSQKHEEKLFAPSPSLAPPSPCDSFFSSQLNPQSPAFAPATPPKVLRPPPGLSLPPQQPQQYVGTNTNSESNNLHSHSRNSELLLPFPTYGPYGGSLLPYSPADTLPRPSPPGLSVHPPPMTATLPPGCGSPIGFRASAGPSTSITSPSLLPDNPFLSHCCEEENDAQIEAELQELGGRMIGSILDS